MRILKILFSLLVVLSLLGAIGVLIGREVLLAMGMAKLREGISTMVSLRLTPGSVAQQCQTSNLSDPTQSLVDRIQLTFSSARDFQVEIVCRFSSRVPIVVKKFSLPQFVEKEPGSSGLIWGEESSGVTLNALGRRRSLIVQDKQVVYQNGSLPAEIGIGPVANCVSFGYSCCPAASTVGEGIQITGVTDCPRSCFSQCTSRPVLLSFTTQPFFDPQSRTVQISTGEQVTFNFLVDAGTQHVVEAALDFGDGSRETSQEAAQEFVHTYTCSTANCEYTAKLDVIDSQGVSIADTPINHFTILVKGP